MPNEAELRLHRCCFTGHRPEKLNCPEERVKALLDAAVRQAVEDGRRGAALGDDVARDRTAARTKSAGHAMRDGLRSIDVEVPRSIVHRTTCSFSSAS